MSTEPIPHHSPTTTADPTTSMYRAFLPPLARGQRTLDRAAFKKTMPMTYAKILIPRLTSEIRKNCRSDWFNPPFTLHLPSLKEKEHTCRYFLKPDVKRTDLGTVSEAMRGYVEGGVVSLEDYEWEMGYEAWGYNEIITAILPEELHSDIPSSFTQIGHIAHLNLRNAYLPYKSIIGTLTMEKSNGSIRTVVNKLDNVGVASKFRTFPMEVLAGDLDTVVEVHELDCIYRFDFKDVYWNSRLETEHRRIVDKCKEGEAVCDAMAGVGPFAIPLGKKNVITWANDLNPASFKSLRGNIISNKVTRFVFASKDDGALHIRQSIRKLYKLAHSPSNTIALPLTRKQQTQLHRLQAADSTIKSHPDARYIPVPQTFSHFIMNLPESAITFLHAFIGAYHGLEHLFAPTTDTEMPWIHVYCFQNPIDDATDLKEITARISKYLQFELPAEDIELHYVRRVAPMKVMYCASFRLPREVAFADPASVIEESEFTQEEKEELERLIRWEIIQ